jgi:hypothetical protein
MPNFSSPASTQTDWDKFLTFFQGKFKIFLKKSKFRKSSELGHSILESFHDFDISILEIFNSEIPILIPILAIYKSMKKIISFEYKNSVTLILTSYSVRTTLKNHPIYKNFNIQFLIQRA